MPRPLRFGEVVLELAPLVPRHIGIDQVIPLEKDPDPSLGQAVITQLLQRGRDAQRQRPGRLREAIEPGRTGRTPGHGFDRTPATR